MMDQIRELGARLRNLFVLGEFQKRYDDDRIQVKTHNVRVIEKQEAFPYGFYAKAKSGKAMVLCQNGNFDGFEILPVMKDKGVFRPALEDGDTALYTGEGSYVILREKGDLKVYTRKGGNITVTCEGDCNVQVAGNCGMDVAGDFDIKAANFKVTAGTINLN
ncbi:MAG: hypothetical protein LBG57_04565 [Treponema sp.]|jgi:phage gp45-like|nr:hypothetical protein [Treponema sp.]